MIYNCLLKLIAVRNLLLNFNKFLATLKVSLINCSFLFIHTSLLTIQFFGGKLKKIKYSVKISKPNTTIGKSHSCGDNRCKCCRHMQHSSSYTSKVTGKQYKIFCTVNCKSANIIYILQCFVCGLQYVGESKQPFHKRLNGHRSDLTKKPFLPVSQHFGLSDHSLEDFNRMKILVIEQNCLWSDFQRENRERFWIKELCVLHPDGINRKQ